MANITLSSASGYRGIENIAQGLDSLCLDMLMEGADPGHFNTAIRGELYSHLLSSSFPRPLSLRCDIKLGARQGN